MVWKLTGHAENNKHGQHWQRNECLRPSLPAKAEKIFSSATRLYKFFCSVIVLSNQHILGPFRRVKLPVHFHPVMKYEMLEMLVLTFISGHVTKLN